MNAAEEMAFHAFCAGRIGFLTMADVVEDVMDAMMGHAATTMDAVFAADAEARRRADEIIDKRELAA